MRRTEFTVAMLEPIELVLRNHLLRKDGHEDLTFALYRPITGSTRSTALIFEALLPASGERSVHGNASFQSQYFERVLAHARERDAGIAFLHSHPLGIGWQGMSGDDLIAERRMSPAVLATTGLPLVGLTLAGNGDYSARQWLRKAPKCYVREDAVNVRVVGRRLSVSFPSDGLATSEAFDRTDLVWGRKGRLAISRLRIGIVGLGSVGSIVAESIARIGVEQAVLVDGDHLALLNLDRTLNATGTNIGAPKVSIAAAAMRAHAPGRIEVTTFDERCDEPAAYSALLDCDFVFCCVDRPWGRRILNQLSYANAIPVSNGGLLARTRKGSFIGADWHVHIVGPGRRCMQCWNAFNPGDAALDRDGYLDDPSYVKELDPSSPLVAHANAIPYALSVASMQVMQLASLLLGPIFDLGDWNFHAATGTCDVTEDVGCKPDCAYAEMTGDARSVPPLQRLHADFPTIATPAANSDERRQAQ
jgi:molybdopterin-synthase adenylyltransferase